MDDYMSDETKQQLRDAVQNIIGLNSFVLVVDTTTLGNETESSLAMVYDQHSSTFNLIGLLTCATKGMVG